MSPKKAVRSKRNLSKVREPLGECDHQTVTLYRFLVALTGQLMDLCVLWTLTGSACLCLRYLVNCWERYQLAPARQGHLWCWAFDFAFNLCVLQGSFLALIFKGH